MTPINQKELIGYNNLFSNLIYNYEKNNLPNKILFSGRHGIGKSTLSYHLTNYLLSKNEKFSYNLEKNLINENNNSFKLLLSNTHPNFFNISLNPDKKNIELSQVKNMINFTNKSSFDNKSKIIMIDNVESLNSSSSNALLKNLEEPNANVLFLLIYNNYFMLSNTIKSRCVEFKLNLNINYCKQIVSNLLGENVINNFSTDFLNLNMSPSFYISLYNFCIINEIDYSNISIEQLLKFIISKRIYIKDPYVKNNIKLFIEIFFKKKYITNKSNFVFEKYNYFNSKYSSVINFNLDFDTYILEFNSLMLNE